MEEAGKGGHYKFQNQYGQMDARINFTIVLHDVQIEFGSDSLVKIFSELDQYTTVRHWI